MLRDMLGEATLALLSANTPEPVPTYRLPPLAKPVEHTPPSRARVNGVEIEYDSFGDRAHPPVLLIMGLAGQMVAWHDDFCARMAARGFWVIRFDNRDIGRSTWLDHEPAPNPLRLIHALRRGEPLQVPYQLFDMARDTTGLLDWLGIESAHVVGVSMGGMIAQCMAIQAPARVRTLTSVMSHTGERDLPHPHWRARMAMFVPAPRDRSTYLRRAVRVWRILNGPCFAIDLARTLEQSERAYARGVHPVGVLRQLAAILASPSRVEKLAALSVATLVLHGDRDPLVPVEGGRRTAAAIPGAELEIIRGMGHALPPPLWERIINRFVRHAAANPLPKSSPTSLR